MDLPNRDDLFTVGRRFVRTAPNTRINPNLVDVAGSDLNLIVGVPSLMGEAVVAAMARCQAGQFFDSSRKDQLDRLASDRLGLPRKPENPATVDLLLARPTAVAGGGTVAASSRVQTADGTAFSLDVDVVFGSGVLSQTGTGTALVAGVGGNVAAGAIRTFLDAPFDATIVPSNPTPAAGGAAAESDAAFKGRIRGFFATIRRGVLGAIEFGATTVPGVAVSKAYEVENPGTGLPGGAVELIIGDANGNATTDMIQAVRDVMLTYRAAGIPVIVSSGIVVRELVSWLLSYQTGIDTKQAQSNVRAITVALNQFNAPGAPMRRATLLSGASSVPGVIVAHESLVAPAGDVFPVDNNHIIRVLPEDVSFL